MHNTHRPALAADYSRITRNKRTRKIPPLAALSPYIKVIPLTIMGFLGLELFEKKTKISNEIPVNDNRSSGFHLLEIHLPSIGLGAVTLGLLILAAVVVWYLAYRYRAMS